jgi:hypothetical protein
MDRDSCHILRQQGFVRMRPLVSLTGERASRPASRLAHASLGISKDVHDNRLITILKGCPVTLYSMACAWKEGRARIIAPTHRPTNLLVMRPQQTGK